MINFLGKSLAFVHVSLSILLMAFAAAALVSPLDFGWKEPRRFWSEPKKENENLLVASELDKAEAAVRKMVRFKQEELYQLGLAQQNMAGVEPWLGNNHVKGMKLLDMLENSQEATIEINEPQLDDKGKLVLEPSPKNLGFPDLVLPDQRKIPINKSYVSYQAELRKFADVIKDIQAKMEQIVADREVITRRLNGELDKDGKPLRNPDGPNGTPGSIIEPGWHYLVELEMETQRQLRKELEYLQPLWVKELVDAQLLVTRRDLLLDRLHELGDERYLKQSEFLTPRIGRRQRHQ